MKSVLIGILGWLGMAVAASPGTLQVTAEPAAAFFVAKDRFLILVDLETKPPAPDTVWTWRERSWRGSRLTVALPPGATETVAWRNGGQHGEWQGKAPDTHRRFLTLDQGCKVFAPFFVRRGEEVHLFAECWNRWNLPLTFAWEFRGTPELAAAPDRSGFPELTPPAPPGRFAPGRFQQEKVTFNSSALPPTSWSCVWQLSLPGCDLLASKVIFAPVGELPELDTDAAGNLVDAQGSRIVPVLANRTLGEQRTWELPRRLLRDTLPIGTGSVVGCDFGNAEQRFSSVLRKACARLKFHDWGGSRIGIAEVASALNFLMKNPAGAVVIVLPPTGMRVGGDREWAQYVELLENAAWSHPETRKVTLVILPSSPYEPERADWLTEIRKLTRNRDTAVLELDLYWTVPERAPFYREFPDDESVIASCPHPAAKELGEIVSVRAL